MPYPNPKGAPTCHPWGESNMAATACLTDVQPGPSEGRGGSLGSRGLASLWIPPPVSTAVGGFQVPWGPDSQSHQERGHFLPVKLLLGPVGPEGD